ncbi:MAG: NADH-quinone oxidoreductase subunit G [Gammaproteobacteria bacterium]|nr:MAG: NADH-quinone oxidoreductase subunit G [Gammaproteobacteria bacterium]
MSEETVQIFINDKEVTAPKGAMVIEVTDQHDVEVPRFCYHKKLSVAANCRMCMVEVENAPKPLPACATPVMEGMKVYTKSPLALDAQQGTMEFLLINHPLDCPVCDQGGECELQDVAMGYGNSISRYTERKRVVQDKELGPLVSTDMTRCIHCTRCVRFGTEIAGISELGSTGRGEFMEIGTYVEKSLSSELSGNVIDVCPVGALNAKPSRMSARAWEVMQSASVMPHDSVGSNVYLHTLRNQVMRVVPRENDDINETWISDRDRFSYEGLNASDRATQVMSKTEQGWQAGDWDTSLAHVADKLKHFQVNDIGILAAPHSTLEELYLLQKIFRQLGVNNIDHRTQQIDFTDQEAMPLFPYLGQSIKSIEENNSLFLVGSNIRLEQPMLAHRIRKASAKGCEVSSLNPQQYDFHFTSHYAWSLAPQQWLTALAEIAKCSDSLDNLSTELKSIVNNATVSEDAKNIYNSLKNGQRSSIMLGAIAEGHPQASVLRALSNFVAQATNSNFGILAQSGNTVGAWLSGVLPHRLPAGEINTDAGLNSSEMLAVPRRAYVLFNLEAEFDFANSPAVLEAMQAADLVVVFTPYNNERIQQYADVILPIATFAETDGTFVNTVGHWQSIGKAVSAPGEARPAWKVLRVLANKLGFDDVQYQTSEQIRDELKKLFSDEMNFTSHLENYDHVNLKSDVNKLHRVSDTPVYAVDNIVRRAASLQKAAVDQESHVAMSVEQAKQLNMLNEQVVRVVQDKREVTLPLRIVENMPDHCVWIQKSSTQVDVLGEAIAPVEIQRTANV